MPESDSTLGNNSHAELINNEPTTVAANPVSTSNSQPPTISQKSLFQNTQQQQESESENSFSSDNSSSSEFNQEDSGDDASSDFDGSGGKKEVVVLASNRARKEFGTDQLDANLYGLRRSNRSAHPHNSYSEADFEDSSNSSPHYSASSASSFGAGKRGGGRRTFVPEDSDEDSDYVASGGRKKNKKKKLRRLQSSNKDESEVEEESESEEESDWEDEKDGQSSKAKRRNQLRKRKQKRKTARNSDNEVGGFGSRFSTRNRKVATYDDDVDDEEFLASSGDEDGAYQLQQVAYVEYSGDSIDLVMNHRYVNAEEEPTNDEDSDQLQVMIKWTGKSHMHNTWEFPDSLQQMRGYKKVENYLKANVTYGDESQAEQCELRSQVLQDYVTVERVIDSHHANGDSEYLCKWKNLAYEHCTWELAADISDQFQDKIDDYLNREQSQKIPPKSLRHSDLVARKRSFRKLTEQPAYITEGSLRSYQLEGVSWLAYSWSRNTNGILADEMGLGKTVQTISFIRYMYHQLSIYGPFLIVVPLSVLDNWYNEFNTWAPELNVIVYIGNSVSRETVREHEIYRKGTKQMKINVLITTFEIVLKDAAFLGAVKWSYLAVDEAHRLKNNESQLYDVLKDFKTGNRLLITGTPLQNTVKELWALLNFLHPELYSSFEEFEDPMIEGGTSEDAASKVQDLQAKLKPHLLRRMKKDVEASLPQKNEYILRIGLAREQLELYKNLHCRNFEALKAGGNQVSLLNLAIELKKCSNHPFLFDGIEKETNDSEEIVNQIIRSSGKMYLLDQLLAHFKANGHRVLIFSQMVRMLDIISDYLKLRRYSFQRLDGSTGNEDRKKAIQRFNAPDSPDFAFILSTRAGGLGINLDTADTVILYDSDWNPQNDLQAMARAHRIGQKNTVNIYRLIAKDTIEEQIFERAKAKMVLEHAIIGNIDASGTQTGKGGKGVNKLGVTKEELDKILKFGASNLFKKVDEDSMHSGFDKFDINEFLKNAEKKEETVETNVNDEFLNQFKVADFGTWEDVIPENEIQKFKEEEVQREIEDIGYTRRRTTVKTYAEEMMEKSGAVTAKKATAPRQRKPPTDRSSSSGGKYSDKLIRACVKAILKFGSQRIAEITKDIGGNQQEEQIKQLVTELMSICTQRVQNSPPEESKSTKQKAIMIEFEGVGNINASAIVQRVPVLDELFERLGSMDESNLLKFRLLSKKVKPVTNWAVSWGVLEDSRLLVGVFKYGYGSWTEIGHDEKLGLSDKMPPPNSTRLPQGIHLTRRIDTLLSVLLSSAKNEPGKKQQPRKSSSTTQAKPTTSSSSKRVQRKSNAPSKTSDDDDFSDKPMAPLKKRIRLSHNNNVSSESSGITKEIFEPVSVHLDRLKAQKETDPREFIGILKECIPPIGDYIKQLTSSASNSVTERKLWQFVLDNFWPKENMDIDRLQAMYNRIVDKQRSSQQTSPS